MDFLETQAGIVRLTETKSQLKTKTTEEISKATGGFGIPGFKWPL